MPGAARGTPTGCRAPCRRTVASRVSTCRTRAVRPTAPGRSTSTGRASGWAASTSAGSAWRWKAWATSRMSATTRSSASTICVRLGIRGRVTMCRSGIPNTPTRRTTATATARATTACRFAARAAIGSRSGARARSASTSRSPISRRSRSATSSWRRTRRRTSRSRRVTRRSRARSSTGRSRVATSRPVWPQAMRSQRGPAPRSSCATRHAPRRRWRSGRSGVASRAR